LFDKELRIYEEAIQLVGMKGKKRVEGGRASSSTNSIEKRNSKRCSLRVYS